MKVLWTDGSAEPNPGPGGYAVIIQLPDGSGHPVCLGREANTTNIRMEGSALIAAINYAGDEPCEIHTDSQFWINVVTQWASVWERRNWRKSQGAIKNLDLVKKLFGLYRSHDVELIWVHGHSGITLNELADTWANKARAGATMEDIPS